MCRSHHILFSRACLAQSSLFILFQGKFRAQVVEADEYARELIEYIHLNPARPRDRRKAIPTDRRGTLDAWKFSSHRAYAGLDTPPAWLCTQWLSYFGDSVRSGRRNYRRSIAQRFSASIASPWSGLRRGLILGGERFADRIADRLAGRSGANSIRWTLADSESKLQTAVTAAIGAESDWRVQLWLRIKLGGESSSAIARELGYTDSSGVHRVVARLEEKARTDASLKNRLATLKMAVMSNVKS